jgi:hypothetical protein
MVSHWPIHESKTEFVSSNEKETEQEEGKHILVSTMGHIEQETNIKEGR